MRCAGLRSLPVFLIQVIGSSDRTQPTLTVLPPCAVPWVQSDTDT
jgi:hypothetical protein